jgi:hypothetical protein
MAHNLGLKTDIIGKIGGGVVKMNDIEIDLNELKNIYFNRFQSVVEQDI